MTPDLQALTDAALSLEPGDRLALASLLIDSVENASAPDWEAAWTKELGRRSDAADERAVRGAPWSEVRARLLRDLAGR